MSFQKLYKVCWFLLKLLVQYANKCKIGETPCVSHCCCRALINCMYAPRALNKCQL